MFYQAIWLKAGSRPLHERHTYFLGRGSLHIKHKSSKPAGLFPLFLLKGNCELWFQQPEASMARSTNRLAAGNMEQGWTDSQCPCLSKCRQWNFIVQPFWMPNISAQWMGSLVAPFQEITQEKILRVGDKQRSCYEKMYCSSAPKPSLPEM